MNQRKPLRFLQLFTEEELRDLYEDSAFNPASQVVISKPNAAKPKSSISVRSKNSIPRPSLKPPLQSKTTSSIPLSINSHEKILSKKLFDTSRKEIIRQTFKVKGISRVRKRNALRDDFSPLIDLSTFENQLPTRLEFKKPVVFKEKPKRVSSSSNSSLLYKNSSYNELENGNTSKVTSSGEKEFIELEEKCNVKASKKRKKNTINDRICSILLSDSENFVKLKTKFANLRTEFENFTANHEENMKEIRQLLNLDDKISKQVTFNYDTNEDNGFEKAITMYNSMRKNCTNILRTPKGDRSCLRTPRNVTNKVKESLSIKLQKQCLLLQDTPKK